MATCEDDDPGRGFAQQLVLEAIYVVTKENEARDDEDVESGAANPLAVDRLTDIAGRVIDKAAPEHADPPSQGDKNQGKKL